MITTGKLILPSILLAVWPSHAAAITKYEWDGNPQIVGKCFSIAGRLAQYNGGATFRIWRIGTHRMFAATCRWSA
ncbi:MAG TPA: hypothetical protein VGK89_05200 [Candidatus Eisenbacteria bacterium]|jgi:hypothetical protein